MTKNEINWIAGRLASIKKLDGQTLEEWKSFARAAMESTETVSKGEMCALLQAFVSLIEAVEMQVSIGQAREEARGDSAVVQ